MDQYSRALSRMPEQILAQPCALLSRGRRRAIGEPFRDRTEGPGTAQFFEEGRAVFGTNAVAARERVGLPEPTALRPAQGVAAAERVARRATARRESLAFRLPHR